MFTLTHAMSLPTLAIVNPAAGFGKAAKLLGPAMDRLRASGVEFDVAETQRAGHAAELARQGYKQGYRKFIAPQSEWSSGLGVAFVNQPNMRSYFGVTELSAQQIGIAAYAPNAGLCDVRFGTGITSALTEHWIAFAAIGGASLRGQATASPLARATGSVSASAGIAYRWGP